MDPEPETPLPLAGNRPLPHNSGLEAPGPPGDEHGLVQLSPVEYGPVARAVSEAERLLRAMFDSSQSIGVILDADGKIVFANERLLALTGNSSPDILSQDFFDLFVPPGQREAIRALYRQGVRNGLASLRFKAPFLTRSGEERTITWNHSIQVDAEGRAIASGLVGQDLSAEKSEAADKRSERFLRVLVEKAPGAIVIFNKEARITFCNPGISTMLGYDPGEILGRSGLEFIHPDDLPRALENVRGTIGVPRHVERHAYRVRHKDGSWRLIEATSTNLLADPDIAGILMNALDVTERARAESSLRESQRRFHELLRNVQLAGILLDADGNITFVNDYLMQLSGYAHEELVGRNWFQMFAPIEQQRQRIENYTALLRRGVPPRPFEYPLITKAGREKIISWNPTLLRDEAGEPIGMAGLGEDVTRRRRAEAQRAQKTSQTLALARVGRAVLKSLDLDVVLKQVVLDLSRLVPGPEISILLLQGNELVFSAVGGEPAQELLGLRIPADRGIPGQVLRTYKWVYISDGLSESWGEGLPPQFASARSMFTVPLSHQDRALGVLQAATYGSQSLSNMDISLLEIGSHWAAIAISNARQHGEVQRQLQEAQGLSEINRALTGTLDLDLILRRVVDLAQSIIANAEHASIHLLSEGEPVLYPVVRASAAGKEHASIKLGREEGIAGAALNEGRAINVSDTSQDPRYVVYRENENMRSLLVAPLIAGTERLGTLSVQSSRKGAFSSSDAELLTQFALQASIALKNARLFRETKALATEMSLLYDAGLALGASPDLAGQIRLMLRTAVRAVGADYALYYRYLPETEEFRFEEGIGPVDGPLDLPCLPLLSARRLEGVMASAARSRLPLAINNLREDARWTVDRVKPMGSGIWSPLVRQERLLGILVLLNQRADAYSSDHQRWLALFAGQIAISLDNARLLQQLEASLQEEKKMREQLVLADKLSALGQMTAAVAHELNSPLQALGNCIYIARNERRSEEKRGHYLGMAAAEVDRLSRLVSRLELVYQPGRRDDQPAETLRGMMSDVSELIRPHLRDNNITWKLLIEPRSLGRRQVPAGLRQVVLNLCLNAVDAMKPNGGTLVLRTQQGDDAAGLKISVCDTGSGIRPEDLPNIFEPFFTTKPTGTGLGLPISYDIVHSYGGELTVLTEVQQGSTFTVWLPDAAARANGKKNHESAKKRPSRRRRTSSA